MPKAKFNPQVEREKWIIEELMKPPGTTSERDEQSIMEYRLLRGRLQKIVFSAGWSPYDYPSNERDKISFDGWKREEEVAKKPATTSAVGGLDSLFTQAQNT